MIVSIMKWKLLTLVAIVNCCKKFGMKFRKVISTMIPKPILIPSNKFVYFAFYASFIIAGHSPST